MRTKLIALSAITALTLSFAGQSFASLKAFTDLTNVAAMNKIVSLQERGIIQGVSKDLFLPYNALTAAQGVQLIVNALDLNLDLVRFIKEPKATDYFKKANNDAWYANTLIIAAVNGTDLPADLDPNQPWTREEFTHHLIHAMETHSHLPMIKLMPVEIADQAALTVDYSGSIQRALSYGIIALDEKANFHPQAKITRAEAAVQVYNALDYLEKHPAPKAALDSVPTE